MTRPRFRIDLEHVADDVPAVIALRMALKALWRRFRLKALRVEEMTDDPGGKGRPATEETDR